MVKLNRIYTRTGDAGETGLADGSRRRKDDARLAAIGDVDETNAALGLARVHADALPAVASDLQAIQNDLFDLGAELAVPGEKGADSLVVTPAQVAWLEARIDALNADLEPLRSFVLPAGGALAAHLHLARAVCRRAERTVVTLLAREPAALGAAGLAYLNRLSDYLFVAARTAARAEGGEVTWQPGAGRGRGTA